MCIRSVSMACAKRSRDAPASDIIRQLLELKPRVETEAVQQVMARHRLDHENVRRTMQELKEQKRFDLVGLVFSETLKAGGTKFGPKAFTTGISACARAKDWQLAMHLFDSMCTARVTSNAYAYNATISACEKGGQWQLAM